jgi:Uncharacterized protein conserved in bacteria (DUF2188)
MGSRHRGYGPQVTGRGSNDMTSAEVETYYEQGAWKNAVVPGEDLGGPYPSRDEAVAAGREAARERGVDHVVRDEEGTVVDQTSVDG